MNEGREGGMNEGREGWMERRRGEGGREMDRGSGVMDMRMHGGREGGGMDE